MMGKKLRSLLNQCTQKRTGSHECLLCAGIDEYEPIHAPDCAVPAARAELEALEAENERLRAELAEADKRGWRRGIEESLRIFDEECDNLCPGVPEEAGGVLFEIEYRLRGLIGQNEG